MLFTRYILLFIFLLSLGHSNGTTYRGGTIHGTAYNHESYMKRLYYSPTFKTLYIVDSLWLRFIKYFDADTGDYTELDSPKVQSFATFGWRPKGYPFMAVVGNTLRMLLYEGISVEPYVTYRYRECTLNTIVGDDLYGTCESFDVATDPVAIYSNSYIYGEQFPEGNDINTHTYWYQFGAGEYLDLSQRGSMITQQITKVGTWPALSSIQWINMDLVMTSYYTVSSQQSKATYLFKEITPGTVQYLSSADTILNNGWMPIRVPDTQYIIIPVSYDAQGPKYYYFSLMSIVDDTITYISWGTTGTTYAGSAEWNIGPCMLEPRQKTSMFCVGQDGDGNGNKILLDIRIDVSQPGGIGTYGVSAPFATGNGGGYSLVYGDGMMFFYDGNKVAFAKNEVPAPATNLAIDTNPYPSEENQVVSPAATTYVAWTLGGDAISGFLDMTYQSVTDPQDVYKVTWTTGASNLAFAFNIDYDAVDLSGFVGAASSTQVDPVIPEGTYRWSINRDDVEILPVTKPIVTVSYPVPTHPNHLTNPSTIEDPEHLNSLQDIVVSTDGKFVYTLSPPTDYLSFAQRHAENGTLYNWNFMNVAHITDHMNYDPHTDTLVLSNSTYFHFYTHNTETGTLVLDKTVLHETTLHPSTRLYLNPAGTNLYALSDSNEWIGWYRNPETNVITTTHTLVGILAGPTSIIAFQGTDIIVVENNQIGRASHDDPTIALVWHGWNSTTKFTTPTDAHVNHNQHLFVSTEDNGLQVFVLPVSKSDNLTWIQELLPSSNCSHITPDDSTLSLYLICDDTTVQQVPYSNTTGIVAVGPSQDIGGTKTTLAVSPDGIHIYVGEDGGVQYIMHRDLYTIAPTILSPTSGTFWDDPSERTITIDVAEHPGDLKVQIYNETFASNHTINVTGPYIRYYTYVLDPTTLTNGVYGLRVFLQDAQGNPHATAEVSDLVIYHTCDGYKTTTSNCTLCRSGFAQTTEPCTTCEADIFGTGCDQDASSCSEERCSGEGVGSCTGQTSGCACINGYLNQTDGCATCLDPNRDYNSMCTMCVPGQFGSMCEQDQSTCSSSRCNGYGNCTGKTSGCSCETGYDPATNCSLCLNTLLDPLHACSQCLNPNLTVASGCTECHPNKYGPSCEMTSEHCSQHRCNDVGTCEHRLTGCICPSGYNTSTACAVCDNAHFGASCEITKLVCDTSRCHGNGTCTGRLTGCQCYNDNFNNMDACTGGCIGDYDPRHQCSQRYYSDEQLHCRQATSCSQCTMGEFQNLCGWTVEGCVPDTGISRPGTPDPRFFNSRVRNCYWYTQQSCGTKCHPHLDPDTSTWQPGNSSIVLERFELGANSDDVLAEDESLPEWQRALGYTNVSFKFQGGVDPLGEEEPTAMIEVEKKTVAPGETDSSTFDIRFRVHYESWFRYRLDHYPAGYQHTGIGAQPIWVPIRHLQLDTYEKEADVDGSVYTVTMKHRDNRDNKVCLTCYFGTKSFRKYDNEIGTESTKCDVLLNNFTYPDDGHSYGIGIRIFVMLLGDVIDDGNFHIQTNRFNFFGGYMKWAPQVEATFVNGTKTNVTVHANGPTECGEFDWDSGSGVQGTYRCMFFSFHADRATDFNWDPETGIGDDPPTAEPVTHTGTSTSSGGGGGLSLGAILGIVFGSLAGLVIIIVTVVCTYKNRNQSHKDYQQVHPVESKHY